MAHFRQTFEKGQVKFEWRPENRYEEYIRKFFAIGGEYAPSQNEPPQIKTGFPPDGVPDSPEKHESKTDARRFPPLDRYAGVL